MTNNDLIEYRKRDKLLDIYFKMVNIYLDKFDKAKDDEEREKLVCEIYDIIGFLKEV